MVCLNNQHPRLQDAQGSTAPLRSYSPVLLEYPWRHGFVAHAGPILPWVVQHRPRQTQLSISQLIESIARSVDRFDSQTIHKHPSSDFVRDILFPATHTSINRKWTTSGVPLSLLGSMMLLYETLDMLLWVYGWEKYPSICHQRPRTSLPKNLSLKLNNVIKLVDDWPSLIEMIPFPRLGTQSNTRVSAPTAGPRSEYDAALDRFCKAIAWGQQSDWDMICAHFHAVGFVLRWIPHHHNSYDVYCEEGSATDSLVSDAGARGISLGQKNAGDQIRKMLSQAHAALGITPIILLVPRKCLNDVGSKEMLFYFSKALGSKPAVLDELEKLVWKIVVEGPEDMQRQLRSLKDLYQEMLPQASHCRAYFLEPPPTDGVEELPCDISNGSDNELSMEADNGALTRHGSPRLPPMQQVPMQMVCDDYAMTEGLQDDSDTPSEAGIGLSPPAIAETDGQNPLDGSSSNAETRGQPNTLRDSSPATPIPRQDSFPAIAVHDAARETDSDIEPSASEDPIDDSDMTLHPPTPRPHPPRSVKLIVSAKSRKNANPVRRDATRRVATPAAREDRTTPSRAPKRKRIDDQSTNVGGRHVLDVAGVPEPANDLQREPVPLAAETVQILMHGPKSDHLPKQHMFRTSATVASLENDLLSKIYASVRTHYHHGTPLHHLPSASNPDLNDAADRATRSSIFVVPHPDFARMDPLKVQQIFRQRHILVYDAPNRPEEFSERNIAALGGYGRLRNVQDISLRTADAADQCGRGGTLQQFWEESQKPDNGRILNILDIPMRMRDGRHMQGYNSLASHEAAFAETDGRPGYVVQEPPFSKFVWALASMANATSWNHMDAAGVATVVNVESGAKWWALADCPSEPSAAGCKGDLSSIHGLGNGWDCVSSGHGNFRHEAVLLEPGMWLFMRPCTLHYVLTVRNSVTHGRHFYAASTVRSSCWGIIHCSVMSSGITNNEHPQTIQLLRRILHVAFISFREGFSSPHGAEHRIDPTTPEGLLDVISLGNTIELLRYLDARFYSGGIDHAESAELDFIIAQYLDFQKAFSDRYAMVIDNKRVDVMESLFKPSILRLAVSIVTYKRSMRSFQAGYSTTSLQCAIKQHLQEHHPDLLQQYQKDLEARRQPDYLKSLDWTGPAFSLESKEVEM